MSLIYQHDHAVWETPAPPVTTAFWDKETWERFENLYRPVDYFGDRTDADAWRDYLEAREERHIVAARERAGFGPDPRAGDPLFGYTVHGDRDTALREATSNYPCVVARVPAGREVSGHATREGWVVYPEGLDVPDVEPEFAYGADGTIETIEASGPRP